MPTIIAGRFAEQAQAQGAVTALAGSGFASGSIAMFFVLPQGQHDMHGQGHDLDVSAGAQEAGTGAAAGAGAGATVGAAIGLAAAPLLGPAGPIGGAAVGAYIGSLHGTLNKLDPGEQNGGGATDTAPPKHEAAPRRSGFVVAVETRSDDEMGRAIQALQSAGTGEIERASGKIADGKWDDFDPVSPPELIMSPNPRGDPELPRLLDPSHSRR